MWVLPAGIEMLEEFLLLECGLQDGAVLCPDCKMLGTQRLLKNSWLGRRNTHLDQHPKSLSGNQMLQSSRP